MAPNRADESLHLNRFDERYGFITIYHVMLVIPEFVFSCLIVFFHANIASLFILTERNKTETSTMLWRCMVKLFM